MKQTLLLLMQAQKWSAEEGDEEAQVRAAVPPVHLPRPQHRPDDDEPREFELAFYSADLLGL